MSSRLKIFILGIFCLLSYSFSSAQISSENWQTADELLSKMNLKEKIGQMTQVTVDVILDRKSKSLQIDDPKLETAILEYQVGSILNIPPGHLPNPTQWYDFIKKIQEKASLTRLKIPVLYGIDNIHGVNYCEGATLFPQPLAFACTWNTPLLVRASEITAYESRAASMPWSFSPALDVGRHPAWPRLWESFGEDVFMNAQMGVAMVKGFQGENAKDKNKIAACLKHYAGYGMPLSGKDRTPAWIPERYLQEYYIPAYAATIDAGALTVMVNSGEINGVPVHASKHLLTDILRDQLGFEGLVVSDWNDVNYLHNRHHIADTPKEAVRLAVEAGLDMSMVPYNFQFADYLLELVEEGKITEKRIDLSVRRILAVKAALGLFDESQYAVSDYPEFGSDEFVAVSRQSAVESIVLAKNDNALLPIPKDVKVLVTGPAANSMRVLNGGWTNDWQGNTTDQAQAGKNTILEAITDRLGEEKVLYHEGCNFDKPSDLQAATDAAQKVDYIILCLGQISSTEDFGNINDLNLDNHQVQLAKAMAGIGKPVILLLSEGRPHLISTFEDQMAAVLIGFLPGPEGGDAFTDILFGDANPSGKLAVTYPRYPNSLMTYDYKYTEMRKVDNSGLVFNPQYTFGHGLSYTTFEYSNLTLNKASFSNTDQIKIEVDVQNTGKIEGQEVVQLYIGDLYASITPSVKRLRGFQKIALKSGEKRKVSFTIKAEDLAFVGLENKWIVEPGDFMITVGNQTANFEIR